MTWGKSHFVFIKFKINREVTINLNLYGRDGMGWDGMYLNI